MSSEVPEDWQPGRLGQFLKSAQGGGTPPRDNTAYWGRDIPWASVKDVTRGANEPLEGITTEGLKNSSARRVAAGTNILATRMAVGTVVRYEVDVAINQDLLALTPSDSLDGTFLFHWLRHHSARFAEVATGTTVKGLRKDILLDWPIIVPPLREQRRIAEVLRSVDDAISLVGRQSEQGYRALAAYATAAFAEAVPEDGEGIALEALLTHIIDYRGVPPPKATSGVPLLTAKNVRFGFLDPEPREFIAEADYMSWMRRGIPAAGDVMFTTEAPLGNVAEFPNYRAALGQRTLTLRADPGLLNPSYLKWLLLSPSVQALIGRHATGSTAKGIKQRTFRKLRFNVPALGTQNEIGMICEGIWTVILASRDQSRAMAMLRHLLADDLLSGRVRMPA